MIMRLKQHSRQMTLKNMAQVQRGPNKFCFNGKPDIKIWANCQLFLACHID